jgi:hypothetical protein
MLHETRRSNVIDFAPQDRVSLLSSNRFEVAPLSARRAPRAPTRLSRACTRAPAAPPLTTSFEGAAEAEDCLCVAGHQNASWACEARAAGKYKAFIGNNSCVACPANSDTLGSGSNELDDCLCLPGYIANSDSDEACAPCPRNTFNAELGGSTCLACPVDSGTEAPASTFASCECEAGYTPGAGQDLCTACAAGKYKATRSMSACSVRTACSRLQAPPPSPTARATLSTRKAARARASSARWTPTAPERTRSSLACHGNKQLVAATSSVVARVDTLKEQRPYKTKRGSRLGSETCVFVWISTKFLPLIWYPKNCRWRDFLNNGHS